MKKQKKGLASRHLSSRILLCAFTILVIALSVIAVQNSAKLQTAVSQKTRAYVSDVAFQVQNNIDFRLSRLTYDLEMVGDSLLKINNAAKPDALKTFLDEKTQSLGFNSLIVTSPDGTSYSTGELPENLSELPGIKTSLEGENGVTILGRQSILYSIPLIKDGQMAGVLAGIRNKENMQELIRTQCFSGLGLTCILDRKGKVIISPTDLEPFLALDDIFVKQDDQNVLNSIEQMQVDMRNGQNGLLSFTAADGTDTIMAYNALGSYDWVLLTLIPANLISYETDQYIAKTYIITACIILLFAALLSAMFFFYRRHRRQLERLAFTDRVTGGINNLRFQLICRELFQKEPDNAYTIVSLNVKNFKLINESFGVQRGDETLRHIMHILEKNLGPEELAARGEADNFFLCLKENEPASIQKRLSLLLGQLNEFNQSMEPPYHLVLLQGAYIVENPFTEVTVMQDRAKTACKNRLGHDDDTCIFYDASFTARLQKEQDLSALFLPSLENEDFKIYLQPKVRLADGRVMGAEALVRWDHPLKGMIYPSDFIPLFEKNGSICQLDSYIFTKVCSVLERWIKEGREIFPISVNLSRQNFKKPGILEDFAGIAGQHHVPTGLIELELTESVFFEDQDIENIKGQIKEMHRLGFLCSLDDFGSGFSSLGLLKEFDVDTIKLDRRFFLDISQKKAKDVVSCLLELSGKLKVHTVAEGIETSEQLDFLRSINCELVQGYIFSRPLPVSDFEAWADSQ
ncbi:EAL domain-containing protein [Qiania dongpingensis]|uniref:EAL domain-containing protein n=1 Tax=Qiania dongpingensis TaxID=2763669 RepID=A0A7G9G1T9_9FIRM|nr:EAL domain-containing protein [Qiania dongpingensis]QNM04771.1 EAL domain-containing protein [Qiania dongpingensis]